MHVSLIVPAPFAPTVGSLISSADTYEHEMASSLRTLGHVVDIVELAGHFPDPDQTAIDAAHNAWNRLAAGSVPLIDGRVLLAFASQTKALGLRRTTALVHHPASQETHAAEEICRQLRAREDIMFPAMAQLVVTSETTADRLAAEFTIDRALISVIAPGIGDRPRSHGGPDRSTCAILSVGALIPRKGHDVLLQALSRLFDLDWTLTIAGAVDRDPVHAQGLLALAEHLHIAQHVHLAGAVDADALEALWQGADLFALASWSEGYGTALAEALRRGLAVAVTATGATLSLVPPEAGVMCAPGEVEQLSKALRRLIFDQSLRQDMAAVAWQSGQTLPSWLDQAARLAAILGA